MKSFNRLLISTILLFSFCSCSLLSMSGGEDRASIKEEALTHHAISGLLMSYNRSTLGRTDYEQYRLVGSDLIWECGRISAGRYNPQTQNLVPVTAEQQKKILELGAQVHRLVNERGAKFATPGTTPEFFDPGQYTLTLEHGQEPAVVKTTFDSVAIPQAWREHLLNKLTLAVREVVLSSGEPPCGIKEFYHLLPAKGMNSGS